MGENLNEEQFALFFQIFEFSYENVNYYRDKTSLELALNTLKLMEYIPKHQWSQKVIQDLLTIIGDMDDIDERKQLFIEKAVAFLKLHPDAYTDILRKKGYLPEPLPPNEQEK